MVSDSFGIYLLTRLDDVRLLLLIGMAGLAAWAVACFCIANGERRPWLWNRRGVDAAAAVIACALLFVLMPSSVDMARILGVQEPARLGKAGSE